jgi:Na+/H+-dicarboxylate symporter
MSRITDTWRKRSSSPSVLITSVIIGIAIGLWLPGFAGSLALLWDVYLNLLKMIAMPFMVSAIIYSLSQLIGAGETSNMAGKVVKMLFVGMLATAVLGLSCALIIGPGRNLSNETLLMMGQLVGEDLNGGGRTEMTLFGPSQLTPAMTLKELVMSLVPGNIFTALTQGEMLKVLVFSLLFGVVVGRMPTQQAKPLDEGLRGLFQACVKLTVWLNYLMPPVLMAMVAQLVAGTGIGAIKGMLGFLVTIAATSLVLVITALGAIRWACGRSWQTVLASQRESLVMAMATRSGPACMPLMIEGLVQGLGLPRSRVELLVPLAVPLFRIGSVMNYSIATLFIAQMYGRSLGTVDLTLVLIGSVLAGFAAAGMTGVVAIGMIGVICDYIGLPFAALAVLFIAIDPLSDTLRTAVNVASANAFAALGCRGERAISAPGVE